MENGWKTVYLFSVREWLESVARRIAKRIPKHYINFRRNHGRQFIHEFIPYKMEVVERNKAASYSHTVNDTYGEWKQSGFGASKAMLVFFFSCF